MRILVSGATGTVGGELIRQLLAGGVSAGNGTRDNATAGKATANNVTTDNVTTGGATAGNSIPDNATAGKGTTNNVTDDATTGGAAVDNVTIGNATADGVTIRAISRKPGDAKLPATVEVVFGDADQPESISAAAHGIDAAFVVAAGENSGALTALADAGVQRVVYLSALTVQTRPGFPIGSGHEAAERDLRRLLPAATVLRPGQFASNTLWWRGMVPSGTIYAPFPDVATPMIDPYDIAAVAKVVLLDPSDRHDGAAYGLTGPEMITARQRVEILGRVLGRELRLVEIDRETARSQMRLPGSLADAALDLIGTPNAQETELLPTVEEILGRPAHTFVEWAERNRDAFS